LQKSKVTLKNDVSKSSFIIAPSVDIPAVEEEDEYTEDKLYLPEIKVDKKNKLDRKAENSQSKNLRSQISL
jgi:hypothetical protein